MTFNPGNDILTTWNCISSAFVKEVPGKEPEHKVQASLHTLETRLDYMGSAILIGRISDLMVQLNDEWQLQPIPTGAQKYPSMPRQVNYEVEKFSKKYDLIFNIFVSIGRCWC